MRFLDSINDNTHRLLTVAIKNHRELAIGIKTLTCGTTILDFGVDKAGGLEAGKFLAEICLGGLAKVDIQTLCQKYSPAANGKGTDLNLSSMCLPEVFVSTDYPVEACMASQYAGWPVQHEKFFAMGSGPMRAKRGREHVLESIAYSDASDVAIGVLECESIPDDGVCRYMASECRVEPKNLFVCVAPTRSIAGVIQVVARSIETSLHKLFELGFEIKSIQSAVGSAPLPPPAQGFVNGIGRTNDAILYGGRVCLWVDDDDERIREVVGRVPSETSKDWGRPFASIFKDYQYDFYKVDPGLFSPASITIQNLRSGNSFTSGSLRIDILEKSFGIETIDVIHA